MGDLQVIGAGLPRTGTASLRAALEILGYGKCYHMYEVLLLTDRSKQWISAFQQLERGETVDWRPIFAGYQSGVDSPVGDVYIELAKQFPEAKVILTHRPKDQWLKSVNESIMKIFTLPYGIATWWIPELYWQRQMCKDYLFTTWQTKYQAFDKKGKLSADVMDQRVAEAKKAIPKERLLVYQVQEGWEPLCKFLNVPIPSVAFPRVNDKDEIGRFILRSMLKGMLRWLYVVGASGGVLAVLWAQRGRWV
ncbi:P-loop containing nucleoside triphosphate hydrolase protein [Leucosporidium creatinivorum]|uniref:p-loop containing nucleoside triphosphate hydrolase protein n=1 Tax=Leucosporidium creatinivorum TaxID=106004 RepID=A0A1Y2FEI4_9BASI|nr:P-loop containing nucleoside triphosphate hydrolase protein [Leucosporidium creatinivorum]